MNSASDREIFRWRPAAFLHVTGSDAASFLQGQFTNDIRGVVNGARYSLLLNVKGKIVADAFVWGSTDPNQFWICSYACPAATLVERLESFVIADDVTINDQSTEWTALTVFGDTENQLVKTGGLNPTQHGHVFLGRRIRGPHREWLLPQTDVDEAVRSLGRVVELGRTEMERRRIQDGIPLVPVDIGAGDLPNEAGLEKDAISYTKGCYLGQEVMARLKSMGQVRRRLLRVASHAAALPACPAPLFAGGRQVGELRSAALLPEGGAIGLAMLSLLHVTPDTRLSIAPDAAPSIELVDVP